MIRVGFSTSEAAVSRAIRLATHSKVSHVFLTYPDQTLGIDVVLEASWNGLVLHTFASVARSSEIISLVTPAVPLDAGLKWLAANYLGHPYDYLGLLGMPYVLACRAIGRHPRNPLQKASAVFCSESVTLALQASNYPGADKLEAPCVSPQDLYDFMRDHGAKRCMWRRKS